MSFCIKDKEEIDNKTDKIKHRLELQKKIEESLKIISSALKQCKNPIIAFSGGKDSLVMLDLIRKINPNIKAMFNNTTNEYPETIEFIKTIDNIDIIKPKITFSEVIKKYGIPTKKSPSKWKSGKRRNTNCCKFLKEDPAIEYQKHNKIDLVFLGLTASESRNRKFLIKKRGTLYYQKTQKIYKCLPIAYWTVEDIWLYIDINNLEYNKIYDIVGREHRCGCRLCTAYLSWKEVMTKYNPKDIETIYKLSGQKTFG